MIRAGLVFFFASVCLAVDKPAYECPTDNARLYYSMRFDAVKAEALATLQKRDSQVVDITFERSTQDVASYPYAYEIFVHYRNNSRSRAGFFKFSANDGAMSSTERVEAKFSGVGLNKLAFLDALKRFPQTKIASDSFMESNLASFLTALATRNEGKANRPDSQKYLADKSFAESTRGKVAVRIAALKSREDFASFHADVLKAYQKGTPYGRGRDESGFSDVHAVVLTQKPDNHFSINVVVRRGEPSQFPGPLLYLVERSGLVREISGEGRVASLSELPSLGVPSL